jgi:RHH-type transcriptional regulator, rel operon repressor / antitoxin RelB
MTVSMSLRVSDEIFSELEKLAELTERSKSYLVKKAIKQYLKEYADYKIALDRLNDKDDKIISSKEMRKLLGS